MNGVAFTRGKESFCNDIDDWVGYQYHAVKLCYSLQ